MISIIVAIGENRVIGKDNQLIWHLPDDLKRFKRITLGHCVIMGRKTFESMGKALPGRTNIIITRQKDYVKENCLATDSLEHAIELCKNDNEIFIIGGGQIFNEAIPLTDKIYLTHVHHSFEGDVFFPYLNSMEWKIILREDHQSDEKHKYDFSFVDYERR